MMATRFYLCLSNWHIVPVTGPPPQNAVRLPIGVMLLLVPMLGAVFVAFLPVIGMLLVVQHGVRRLVDRVHEYGREKRRACASFLKAFR